MNTTHSRLLERWSPTAALKALAVVIALLALALSTPASSQAVEYHTTCVGHGWVAGSSPTDGSAFSRIETGCGTTTRDCDLYNWGTYKGGQSTSTTICNAWLPDYCACTECASYAKLTFSAAFSQHNHTPDGYCASLLATASARVQAVEPVPDLPAGDSEDLQPDSGGTVTAQTAAAPSGGPELAVRVYRSKTGMLCPDAGRTQDGQFGAVQDGEFAPEGVASSGACFDAATTPVGFAVDHRPASDSEPASATIFGAAPDARSVSVAIGGRVETLELGTAGAFVLGADPAEVKAGASLTATMKDGRVLTYEVPVGDEM